MEPKPVTRERRRRDGGLRSRPERRATRVPTLRHCPCSGSVSGRGGVPTTLLSLRRGCPSLPSGWVVGGPVSRGRVGSGNTFLTGQDHGTVVDPETGVSSLTPPRECRVLVEPPLSGVLGTRQGPRRRPTCRVDLSNPSSGTRVWRADRQGASSGRRRRAGHRTHSGGRSPSSSSPMTPPPSTKRCGGPFKPVPPLLLSGQGEVRPTEGAVGRVGGTGGTRGEKLEPTRGRTTRGRRSSESSVRLPLEPKKDYKVLRSQPSVTGPTVPCSLRTLPRRV